MSTMRVDEVVIEITPLERAKGDRRLGPSGTLASLQLGEAHGAQTRLYTESAACLPSAPDHHSDP